jgi:hypothetical protein
MSEQNLMDAPPQHAAGDFDSAEYGSGSYVDREFDAASAGPNGQPGPGMGQSKSSRRRRRKRRNKQGPGEAAAPALNGAAPSEAPVVMEGESLALAASSQPRRQQQSSHPPPPQQQSSGQNQGAQPQGGQQQAGQAQGKRWKKKFRDRERRPRNDSPGNEARPSEPVYRQDYRPDNFGNLAGGFKRRNKSGGQSRDRSFVGPMDHSYRETSPEFGGAPPSTIQMQGQGRRNGHRHHGDNQPIDHSMPRAVPIPEDAQTHIYFFIEELFFVAKIQEAARKLGVKVSFVKGESKDALSELTTGEDVNRPALIVFDLNNAAAKPLTLIPKLKAKLKRSVSIIGFLSHLQGDLKAKAVEAGCDVVMPRSAFSQNLPNLLRRYGVHDEDDVNFNR